MAQQGVWMHLPHSGWPCHAVHTPARLPPAARCAASPPCCRPTSYRTFTFLWPTQTPLAPTQAAFTPHSADAHVRKPVPASAEQ
eukprot:359965-Chlamydomonas_euryale.AAC.5